MLLGRRPGFFFLSIGSIGACGRSGGAVNRGMIARLRGEIWESLPGRLVIGAGGVGYQVLVPMSTYDALNPVEGGKIDLRTYQHVRENALVLFGFATEEEKDLFLLLIERVSGIGPSMAMSVLSGMPVATFKQGVVEGNTAVLSQIKGLGKKTAERIILELKDKVGVVETWQGAEGRSSSAQDAELALISLGFKQAEARKSLDKALKESPDADSGELIRLGLRMLN